MKRDETYRLRSENETEEILPAAFHQLGQMIKAMDHRALMQAMRLEPQGQQRMIFVLTGVIVRIEQEPTLSSLMGREQAI